MNKTAIVLFNLGGPDKLSAVKPFLFNLFNDPAIIPWPAPFRYLLAKLISTARNKKASNIYEQIGGKSPILETTALQADLLEKQLSFYGDYKVLVSMRYWHPFSTEVVKKLRDYDPDQIVMLPLYPQFSTTTSASSIRDFVKQAKKQKLRGELKYVCCYYRDSKFIDAHTNLIKGAINKMLTSGHKNYRLLFSAHGLPQSVIDNGDPYVFQVESTVSLLIKELYEKEESGNADYRICYQSKVGPAKWTGPSLDFEINRAALDQVPVIVVPITFVSDHSETLVELDITYKEMAEQKKIPLYLRVPALNGSGYFINALADICRRTAASNFICNNGESPQRLCPASFKKCPNNNK